MGLRERLRRVFASAEEVAADEELAETTLHGATPIASCRARSRVRVCGVLRSVTYAGAGANPVLLADLYDGSGSLDLVWLGRTSIPAIAPGRRLLVTGMVAVGEHRHASAIYNPEYTLLAPARAL